MRAFLLLVGLRLKEVRSDITTGFLYFGLPLILLLVTGVMFMKGPPFERRKISIVIEPGRTPPTASLDRLTQFQDLRQFDTTESVALNKLNTHTVNAVLVFGNKGNTLYVGGQDEIFARGLQTIITENVSLRIVSLPRWGYVHYLFPGMLTWIIIVDGLFGMGYSMVHYRRNRFLKKLSLTPLSKMTFVGAQITSRAILAFLQMVLMAIVARLFFKLPLTMVGTLWLACLTMLGLMVFMGAGFALACAIKTEVNMLDTVNAVTVLIILLSEIFFSADELPEQLAAISVTLPSTQLVRLIRTVVLYGDTDAARLMPGLAVLLVWLLITYTISVVAFKWHD